MSQRSDAVRVANERLWESHPELGRRQLTSAPEDAALRSEWRDYFAEASAPIPPPLEVPSQPPPSSSTESALVQSCPDTSTPRVITSIVMKRKHISMKGDDKYGHWWLEISGTESYGWWPKTPVGVADTLFGTDGELNGQTSFGGTPTLDPHHGDAAEEQFSPIISGDDTRTDAEIHQCLRSFASSFSGEWRWTLGAGQNCHTFQEQAMKHCGLEQP